MSVDESADNPWPVFQDRNNSAPGSTAQSGSGGDDLATWSATRSEKFNILVTTTYTNQSAYSIETGMVDANARTFDVRWFDGENDNVTPSNEAQSGSGGNDMAAWSEDRVTMTSLLITTTYSNMSSYTIEHGMVDMEARPFNTRWYNQERDNAQPGNEAQAGSGGEDLGAWSLNREDRIDVLINTTYSNGSSYTISAAMVDMDARPFNTRWRDQERDNAQPSAGASSGDGGGNMKAWTEPRSSQFNTLITTTYSNQAEYEVGNGVTTSPSRRFDIDWEEGDLGNGIFVEGTATDDEGNPLSGNAKIISDGQIIGEDFTSGPITVTAIPPTGVYVGENSDSSTVDFRFTPSIDGIDYIEENIGLVPPNITVQYGRIEGNVTDVDGNPMPDIQVQGSGAATVTDDSGYYRFLCPAGVDTTLLSLKRSHTKDINISAQEQRTVDWEFPGIRVRVYDPNLEPVENAPVFIGDSSYRTDSNGEVKITDAMMTDYPVVVMEYFTAEIELDEEGRLYRLQLGSNSADFSDPETGQVADDLTGLRVKARDAYDQRSIREADVTIPGTGIISYTNNDGQATLLSPQQVDDGDAVPASVCRGDDRYKSASYVMPVDGSTSDEVEVEVDRKTQTVNM